MSRWVLGVYSLVGMCEMGTGGIHGLVGMCEQMGTGGLRLSGYV